MVVARLYHNEARRQRRWANGPEVCKTTTTRQTIQLCRRRCFSRTRCRESSLTNCKVATKILSSLQFTKQLTRIGSLRTTSCHLKAITNQPYHLGRKVSPSSMVQTGVATSTSDTISTVRVLQRDPCRNRTTTRVCSIRHFPLTLISLMRSSKRCSSRVTALASSTMVL